MKKIYLSTIILFLIIFNHSNAYSNCSKFTRSVNEADSRTPFLVDSETYLTRAEIDCSQKAIRFSKMSTSNQVRDISLAQRNHTAIHCKSSGLAGGYGWTVIDILNNANSSWIGTLETGPSDC